jgi:hypothetical protein
MASGDGTSALPLANAVPVSWLLRRFSRRAEAQRQQSVALDDIEKSPKTAAKDFAQRKEEAGIFVTDELDKAIERCRQKVERIAKDCRCVTFANSFSCSYII